MPAPVGTELEVVDAWLADVLGGDATLAALLGARGDAVPNVYAELAPQEAPAPFVTFGLNTNSDVRVVSTGADSRAMVTAVYVVKAVALSESFADLAPIVSRVDELLNGAGPATPAGGGTILGAVRDASIKYVEPPDAAGRQWRHRGGIYTIFAQTTEG